MVINNGFKFSNITGDCYIENDTLVCEGRQLVRIYDFAIENKILLDALSVNYERNEDIVCFTQKYGPLLNWSFSLISESDFGKLDKKFEHGSFEELKRKQFGRFDINLFRNIFARLQNLVNLISAYKQENILSMLRYCLLLLLSPPAQTVDENHQNATVDFSEDFTMSKGIEGDKPLLDAIRDFINTSNVSCVNQYDLEISFFMELLSNIYTICNNNSISVENIIDCKTDINELPAIQNPDFKNILHTCAGIVIADEINFVVCDVKPYFRVLNNDFKGDWIIPDLLSAIYMDIFLKNANSVLLKRCENPTCGEYFETTIENTTKKYCSARCAQLMAKRKQREREKAKNK